MDRFWGLGVRRFKGSDGSVGRGFKGCGDLLENIGFIWKGGSRVWRFCAEGFHEFGGLLGGGGVIGSNARDAKAFRGSKLLLSSPATENSE